MTLRIALQTSLLASALGMLPLAQAAQISQADYSAGKTRISATYKADKTACAALAANAKDVCQEQAKARMKVDGAELSYAFSGKPTDLNKAATVKAETTYAVAKERCDDASGQAKDVCVEEAKAVKAKSLAELKMDKQIVRAETDANTTQRNADYKLAAEKCEILAGDAKAGCVTNAKSTYGKN